LGGTQDQGGIANPKGGKTQRKRSGHYDRNKQIVKKHARLGEGFEKRINRNIQEVGKAEEKKMPYPKLASEVSGRRDNLALWREGGRKFEAALS